MKPYDKCWETGEYTDNCTCELCPHKNECSGYENHDEDDMVDNW